MEYKLFKGGVVMKNYLKLISLVIVFTLAISIIFTGCGKSGESGKDSSSDTSTTDTTNQSDKSGEDSKEKEPVKLKMTFWGSPQEKTAVESAVKKFSEKLPYVTVEATQIPESDYDAKIAAMVASNDPPDYGYIHGQQGEQFALEGKFINWFEELEKDDELSVDDFVDGVWFKIDKDNAWAINTAIECFGLFYNKDIFDEAGIEYPPAKFEDAWTWDKFVEVAKKLTIDKNGKNATEPGFDPNNIKRFGVSFENWYGPVSVHILNNGGDYISADGTKFTLDQPEATRAIQRLADLINVHHVAPSPIQARLQHFNPA